ncbi:MAG: molybdopterin-binding protein [Pedobacter sp.]|nr:MAG: molybdopterin-binding protein [Pedobacter sp.]
MRTQNIITIISFILLFSSAATIVKAQDQVIHVGGDVGKPFDITERTFSTMTQVHVKITGRDSVKHDYTGVSLFDLLSKANAIIGGQLKGKQLTKYVLITAADGYKILLSLAEIDPAFTDNQVVLVNKDNGADLAVNYGPYRLIVAGDKRPARSAMRVTSIDVYSAAK